MINIGFMGVDTEAPKGGLAALDGSKGEGVVQLRMQHSVARGVLVAHRMNDRGRKEEDLITGEFLEGVKYAVEEI